MRWSSCPSRSECAGPYGEVQPRRHLRLGHGPHRPPCGWRGRVGADALAEPQPTRPVRSTAAGTPGECGRRSRFATWSGPESSHAPQDPLLSPESRARARRSEPMADNRIAGQTRVKTSVNTAVPSQIQVSSRCGRLLPMADAPRCPRPHRREDRPGHGAGVDRRRFSAGWAPDPNPRQHHPQEGGERTSGTVAGEDRGGGGNQTGGSSPGGLRDSAWKHKRCGRWRKNRRQLY